jgi:hypothetical protein
VALITPRDDPWGFQGSWQGQQGSTAPQVAGPRPGMCRVGAGGARLRRLVFDTACAGVWQALTTVMRYMAVRGQLEYERFIDFIVEPVDSKLYVNTGH